MKDETKVKEVQGRHSHLTKNATMPPAAALDDPYNILLNEKQAAAFLGLTARTLQQRRYNSQPPAHIRLPKSSAIRYHRQSVVPVASGSPPSAYWSDAGVDSYLPAPHPQHRASFAESAASERAAATPA